MSTISPDIATLEKSFRDRAQELAHIAKTLRVTEVNAGKVLITAQGVGSREVSLTKIDMDVELARFADLLHQKVAAHVLELRSGTKQPAKTIGVWAGADLWSALEQRATAERVKPAQIYRDLMKHGVQQLDARLDKESSSKVFAEMSALLDSFVGAGKAQKMVRIDKNFYNRAVFIAKEFGRSLSEITGMCIVCAFNQQIRR